MLSNQVDGNLEENINVKKRKSEEKVKCACGDCDEYIYRWDVWGKERKYYKTHGGKRFQFVKGRTDPNAGKKSHPMPSGYRRTYDPERYKRKGKGDVYEHVRKYELANNCCVLTWGRVHHKNKIRDDNRPENLEGMMDKDHALLHLAGNQYAKKDMTDRICAICGSTETYIKKDGWHQWFLIDKNDESKGYMCRRCHDKRRIRKKK